MKRIIIAMFVFVLAFSASISAQAYEEPYYTDDCYVKVGGTAEFQTWDTETSFKIEDESIATIDKNGVIHGIKPGHTTIEVVVFDEKYSSWIAGGYSFDEDIYVYTSDDVLSLGDNSVENSAEFTPTETGYYCFTGGSDVISVSDGTYEYYPSANFHDIIGYHPMPNDFLKGGVTYKVTAYNYDDSSSVPVFNVKIEKSVPEIVSATEKNGTVKITVKNLFVNRYGEVVYCVLRKTSDSKFERVGYVKGIDNKETVTFTDTSVAAGETYTYTVRMVDKTGSSSYLSGFDATGKTVTVPAAAVKPSEEAAKTTKASSTTVKPSVSTTNPTSAATKKTQESTKSPESPDTGDSPVALLICIPVVILLGAALLFLGLKNKKLPNKQ